MLVHIFPNAVTQGMGPTCHSEAFSEEVQLISTSFHLLLLFLEEQYMVMLVHMLFLSPVTLGYGHKANEIEVEHYTVGYLFYK